MRCNQCAKDSLRANRVAEAESRPLGLSQCDFVHFNRSVSRIEDDGFDPMARLRGPREVGAHLW
jgi:hypothetical protein